MTLPYILLDYDRVVIEGVVVPRPSGCNVTDWMDFWDAAKAYDPKEDGPDTLNAEIENLKEEVKELEAQVKELERENTKLKARS